MEVSHIVCVWYCVALCYAILCVLVVQILKLYVCILKRLSILSLFIFAQGHSEVLKVLSVRLCLVLSYALLSHIVCSRSPNTEIIRLCSQTFYQESHIILYNAIVEFNSVFYGFIESLIRFYGGETLNSYPKY